MMYYQFDPELAGTTGDDTVCEDWSARPVVFKRLQFELEEWPTADLIEANFSAYAGTLPLADAITVASLTGVEFEQLDMIKGDQFWICEDEHKGETIPEYLWFKFTGKPGVDDFGMTHIKGGFPLIVSERALVVLKQFNLSNSQLKDFEPSLVAVEGLDRSN